VVVMGVAGSGKSAVGRKLAALYHASFLEGDEFHPGKNLRKMRDGFPLSDIDRAPYYAALRSKLLDAATAGESVVLACSALQAKHRAMLNVSSSLVRFVHLNAPLALLRQRLEQRNDHFFNPALLESQLATLEPPTEVNALNVLIDAADSVSQIAARCFDALGARR
jgi:gluconokinase